MCGSGGGGAGQCNAKKVSRSETGVVDEEKEEDQVAVAMAAAQCHVESGECALIAAVASRDPKNALKIGNSVSQWLAVFRALRLKRAAPRAHESLLELEHHCEDTRDSDATQTYKQKVVPAVRALLGHEEDWSQEEILRCCGYLDSNAFRVDLGSGVRALYALASMLNHDCAPNGRVSFDSNKRLHLFAKRDIARGEEISVTYCNPLLGTPARQEKLRRNRFFLCKCTRCNDPTEFGKEGGPGAWQSAPFSHAFRPISNLYQIEGTSAAFVVVFYMK